MIEEYRVGQITFDSLLALVPTLEWGIKREGIDGEIWWEGENTVGDVDFLWYLALINDEERLAILNAIP